MSSSLLCWQVKKHVKPTETTKGGIITMESPVHYSRVSLVDPVTKYFFRTWRYKESSFISDWTFIVNLRRLDSSFWKMEPKWEYLGYQVHFYAPLFPSLYLLRLFFKISTLFHPRIPFHPTFTHSPVSCLFVNNLNFGLSSGAIIPKPVSDYVKKREERISLAKQNSKSPLLSSLPLPPPPSSPFGTSSDTQLAISRSPSPPPLQSKQKASSFTLSTSRKLPPSLPLPLPFPTLAKQNSSFLLHLLCLPHTNTPSLFVFPSRLCPFLFLFCAFSLFIFLFFLMCPRSLHFSLPFPRPLLALLSPYFYLLAVGPKTTAPDAATKQTFTPPSLNDLDWSTSESRAHSKQQFSTLSPHLLLVPNRHSFQTSSDHLFNFVNKSAALIMHRRCKQGLFVHK